MNQTESKWQTHIFGILPHITEPRVLVVPEEKGYSLPSFLHQDRGRWVEDGLIKQEMQQRLGIELNVLYRASYNEEPEKHQAESIYLLEINKPVVMAEGRWVGRGSLADVPLARPMHRPVIEKHLLEAEGGPIPEQRPPWARPGWYKAATSWIEGQLRQRGRELVSPIELVRSWSLSCVLRAQTATDVVYFKAGANLPLFVNEAAVLAELGPRYPGRLPMPLSIEPEQRWMLLADFGAPSYEQATPAQLGAMIYTFGQLQIEAIPHRDELLAMGLLDRRLERLATQIEPLFNDAGAIADLNEDEIGQLHELVPHLKARCEQLATYHIPQTLVHGDLHTGNVTFRNGQPLFFDWTDACISHPFFDVMLSIFYEKDIEVQARLRDRYLSLWTVYEPLARLQEIWSFTRPLFALHHAISYQQIVAGMEDTVRHELNSAIPGWLRKILKYMKDEANVYHSTL